jgi:hypothetical protein
VSGSAAQTSTATRRGAGIVTQASGAGNGTGAPGGDSVKGGSGSGNTGHSAGRWHKSGM